MGDPLSMDKPGDDDLVRRLLPVVYAELKALAGHFLEGQASHTLQPTALVHEAYLKLAANNQAWNDRDHFVATAARAMRQVLVDHARNKNREKRGGVGEGGHGQERGRSRRADLNIETIADTPAAGHGDNSIREMRVLELDELLTHLAVDEPRAARVAEMRLFGGMEQERIARVLGVSRVTVTNDWRFARAWLTSQYRGRKHD